MAMTPEARVKAQVVKVLKKLGVYYFYPVTGGYGTSGVPDIVCCYRGLFFAIECKANGNKPTPLQEVQIRKIKEAGGYAIVANEQNMANIEQWFLDCAAVSYE